MLQAEQLFELVLLQLGADDAQAAGVVGAAVADVLLLRDIVEVQPLAAAGNDALGPEDGTVVAGIQRRQDAADVLLRVGVDRLGAQLVNTSSAWW